VKHLLAELAQGKRLSTAQAVEVFTCIMEGRATAAQTAAVLSLIQARGPSIDEMVGAATVMREKATAVAVPAGLMVIDTCGTGGDHAGTFNISTAAALVAAAAGRPHGVAVAKHGNRSVTSQCGSSQVLEALGVKLTVTGPTLSRCLAEAGICFCFAPAHHPAMKHAAPVRQELGFRTIFNLLGPLTNPAGAKRQVAGVFDAALTEPMAQVLQRMGSEQAMVVHGELGAGRGLDELSLFGPSRISHLKGGAIHTRELDPASLGLRRSDPSVLHVAGVAESAAVIQAVLAGEKGAAREIVALNAGAALVVADLAGDLAEGFQRAGEAIDRGAAAKTLEMLAAITQADVALAH
jgi:anthranilate phosphoribosyltransferase